MTTPSIEFRTPPRPVGVRGRKPRPGDIAVAEATKANPGEWAVLPHDGRKPEALATNVKYGLLRTFAPKGTYEATAQDGEVFVRYVGESTDGE